jgi:hypothetical protein
MLARYGGVADPVMDLEDQNSWLQEWVQAYSVRKRLPPPGVENEDYFMSAMSLPTARARQLALRYYVNRLSTLNTFQAARNTEAARTTSNWVRTVLSSNEEEAVQDLKLMHKSSLCRAMCQW